MKAGTARASGTRLLAAVVLSACVGVIGGGLGAWGVYSHFGPVERVVTETKTGGGAVSVGDIATAVLPSVVTISTQPVTAGGLASGPDAGLTEGFAVSSDGLIVTSAHAVRGATRLRVAAADGKGYDATIAAATSPTASWCCAPPGRPGLTPPALRRPGPAHRRPRGGRLPAGAGHADHPQRDRLGGRRQRQRRHGAAR